MGRVWSDCRRHCGVHGLAFGWVLVHWWGLEVCWRVLPVAVVAYLWGSRSLSVAPGMAAWQECHRAFERIREENPVVGVAAAASAGIVAGSAWVDQLSELQSGRSFFSMKRLLLLLLLFL